MSYRALQVYPENFVRDLAGIAGIVSDNAVDSDHPLDNLIDDRPSTKMKFAAALANHFIDIDLGEDTSIDTLIIPSGHSFGGVTVSLDSGSAHPPVTTTRPFAATAGLIKQGFAASDHQFWRLSVATSGVWEIPEIILTNVKTFTAGPVMEGEVDSFEHPFIRFTQPSGVSPTLSLGPRRRVIDLDYRRMQGTDLTIIEAWIETSGMHKAFWVTPPSFSATPDTDDPAIDCRFDEQPQSRWGVAVPNTEVEKKSFIIRIIENID